MKKYCRIGAAVCLFALLLLPLLISGCGSSGNSTNSSTGTTATTEAGSTTESGGQSSDPAVAAAEATVAKYSAAQPPIKLPPTSGKPPSGVKLAAMSCQLPECQQEIQGVEEGAKALGWKLTTKSAQTTPEGIISTFESLLAEGPEAMVYLGALPKEALASQLAQATKEGVHLVVYTPNGYGAEAGGAPEAAVTSDVVLGSDGRLMGDKVVADSGGKANVLFVNDPTFSFFVAVEKEFDKAVEAGGGKVSQLKVAVGEIGKGVPSAIVSYLQSHPEVEYVAAVANSFTIGVGAALKGAGLDGDVKVISRAPSAANMTEIADGEQWATVADENVAAGWRMVDSLARLGLGEELGSCCTEPDGWHQIFTEENAVSGELPQTPGVPDAFLTAWHLK
jgi:ABC-type sugar transport system substrate-binding protein